MLQNIGRENNILIGCSFTNWFGTLIEVFKYQLKHYNNYKQN